MKILLTGGAGYIGSHTALALLEAGYEVVVVDNFFNSSQESIARVQKLTDKPIPLYVADCTDANALSQAFSEHRIDAVIHFASFKSVNESVRQPLRYYRNNLDAFLTLAEVMTRFKVKKLLFSSTAAVYGTPQELPLRETTLLSPALSPYAKNKRMIEEMLEDLVVADNEWQVTILRYFNPVGAHKSGEIGEDPGGTPSNLLPYITQVAVGKLEYLRVHGGDYETPDGTGIRDYIHVMDLAEGHIAALEHLPVAGTTALYNLSTSRGTSVLELLHAFEAASGITIPYKITDRRPGDIAINYADASKAEAELGWKAKRSIEDSCRDAWRWQSQNPNGYDGSGEVSS